MSRTDYLKSQRSNDPRIEVTQTIARAHLDLATALAQRREALGYSVADVAELSGLSIDRLAQIEEGDTTSLTEVFRLCACLRFGFEVDEGLDVRAVPRLVGPAAVAANPRGREAATRRAG